MRMRRKTSKLGWECEEKKSKLGYEWQTSKLGWEWEEKQVN